MKQIRLSLVSIAALSSLVFAGGDVAAVVEEPIVVEDNSAFYIGLGIDSMQLNDSTTGEEIQRGGVAFIAGYQYNTYVALEGRYHFGISTDYDEGSWQAAEDYDDAMSAWGIYIKPMYPVTEDLDVYALLGYGGVLLTNIAGGDPYESGFQWGLGAQYEVVESWVVFLDYVSLYDGTGFDYRAQLDDVDADVWTLGVSYMF